MTTTVIYSDYAEQRTGLATTIQTLSNGAYRSGNNTIHDDLHRLHIFVFGYRPDPAVSATVNGMMCTPTGQGVEILRNKPPLGSDVLDCTDAKHRVHVRLSKFVAKCIELGMDMTEPQAAALCTYMGQHWPKDVPYEYAVTPGNTDTFPIYKVYAEQYFGSCMHGDEFVKWYDQNGGVVSIVTQRTKDGTLTGRGLLWKGRYLDRLYPTDTCSRAYKAFQAWGTAQGCKHREDWSGGTLEVTMTESDYGYPYMDTLRWATSWRGGVTLACNDGDECLDNTDGSGLGHYRLETSTCECCGDRHADDDMHSVYICRNSSELVCESCRDENYVFINSSDQRWANYEYVHIDECCEVDGGWFLQEDCTELSNGDWAKSEDAVECENGRTVHTDDAVHLSVSDTYIENDELCERHAAELDDYGYITFEQVCEKHAEGALTDEQVRDFIGELVSTYSRVDEEELNEMWTPTVTPSYAIVLYPIYQVEVAYD